MPGVQILGAGNNVTTKVTDDGMLETLSSTLRTEAHMNLDYALSFTVTETVAPSADSNFLYIKNTYSQPLIIVAAEWWCELDEVIKVYRNPSGTPTNGTNITPLNCNFGSNSQSEGVFYYGSNLQGLTLGGLRNIIRLESNVARRYTFDDWTILPRNTSICFHVKNGGCDLDYWIQFFYINERF